MAKSKVLKKSTTVTNGEEKTFNAVTRFFKICRVEKRYIKEKFLKSKKRLKIQHKVLINEIGGRNE